MKKLFYYILVAFFFFAILFQALWLLNHVDYHRLTNYGLGLIAGKLIIMTITGLFLYFTIKRIRKTP